MVSEDVGDKYPRKVMYIPSTGKAFMKRLKHLHNDTVIQRENRYRTEIAAEPVAGEVELF